jgi:serine/threonine-protein kinase
VGDTALVVAVQHLKREPKPLEVLRPDLPPALCRIVHKMLAKDPQRRWQSAQELLGQLRCVYMEHCSQSAPDLDQWQAVPLEPLAQRQMETTRQLDGLMKSAAMQRLGRRGRLALAGGLAACLLLGGVVAWLTTRESPLLAATAPDKGRTPRQDTALRQVCYAIQIGTEEAWRSVVEYHNTKENEYLVRRAKQQLGRIYLRRGDYARALPVFDDLAAAGDADKEFRAFGLAGKAAVLNLQGKYQDSAAVVDKLWDSRSDLRDEPMKRLLDDVIKKNGAELGVAPAKDWDKWLKEQFHPEG